MPISPIAICLLLGLASLYAGSEPTEHAETVSADPRSIDLETFASICEEVPLPPELAADCTVIDLDALSRDESKEVKFDDGTCVRLSRQQGGVIALELVSEADDDCRRVGLESVDAAGELRPIPMPEEGHRDPQLADFQVRYASLIKEGKWEEADALATEFLTSDGPIFVLDEEEIPRELPTEFLESDSEPLRHRVGYGPAERATSGLGVATWAEVADRTITLRFRGATIEEVVSFLRLATGLAVDVVGELPPQQVFLTCTDLPIRDAVEALARVTGHHIVPLSDRIVIRKAP